MSTDQEKELSKLPPAVRKHVEGLLASMGDSVEGIHVAHIAGSNCTHDHKEEKMERVVLRSIKMTPGVAAKLKKAEAWAQKQNGRISELNAQIAAMKAEADAFYAEAGIVKEELYALINVEMGLNSMRYGMRLNAETYEVEIVQVKEGASLPPEPKKSKKK